MKTLLALALGTFTLCASTLAFAAPTGAPTIGQISPQFEATDTQGIQVKLADLKGKTVVLEWTNNECPYVRKHYDSNNMQTLQQEATADGIVWISIVSSAKGKEGNVTTQEANAITATEKAHPTYKILDTSGDIGHLYGAKTTPHMFVIDKNGNLAYAGAIDDKADTDQKSVAGAKNYVRAALQDLKDGKPVATPQTNPYGCGIKY